MIGDKGAAEVGELQLLMDVGARPGDDDSDDGDAGSGGVGDMGGGVGERGGGGAGGSGVGKSRGPTAFENKRKPADPLGMVSA